MKALVRAAGSPLDLVQPDTMRFKVQEPVLLLGQQRFQNVDIRLRVKGGGHISQVYGVQSASASSSTVILTCRIFHLVQSAPS